MRCRVCGYGLAKKDLRLFMNTSCKTEYKGEPDYGHCGNLSCKVEGQARVDMEAINSCLDLILELWDQSGTEFVKMYRAASAPTFTVAQMYKKMKKAVTMYEQKCAEIEYDQRWYDNHWQ